MFRSLVSLFTKSCNSAMVYKHWPDTKDFREIKSLPKGPSGYPLSDNEDFTISQHQPPMGKHGSTRKR